MTDNRLPPGLVATSGSLIFTEDTIPEALRESHALAPGRWGILHIFEGKVGFVNLESGEETDVSAPEHIIIPPEVPHKLKLEGALRCHIDFFRDMVDEPPIRPPGAFTGEEVRQSFERCEAAGDFAEKFYDIFLNSSPEIPPYFAQTDFDKQRKLLRATVAIVVARDVSDPNMRATMDRIGESHSRKKLDVLPRLYELWLDSICETVKALDPEWTEQLEDHWRLRLRAGMQIITSLY